MIANITWSFLTPVACYKEEIYKYLWEKINAMNNHQDYTIPDSKVHGANMGPIGGRQDPGGPHFGPGPWTLLAGIIWNEFHYNTRCKCWNKKWNNIYKNLIDSIYCGLYDMPMLWLSMFWPACTVNNEELMEYFSLFLSLVVGDYTNCQFLITFK